MNFPPHRKHGNTVRYNSDVDDALGSGDPHPSQPSSQDADTQDDGKPGSESKSSSRHAKGKDAQQQVHGHGHKHGRDDDHVADRHHEENVLGQTDPSKRH